MLLDCLCQEQIDEFDPQYIAETLHSNLLAVQDAFVIKQFAVFDQFPWTHHIESGVYLEKREGSKSVCAGNGEQPPSPSPGTNEESIAEDSELACNDHQSREKKRKAEEL